MVLPREQYQTRTIKNWTELGLHAYNANKNTSTKIKTSFDKEFYKIL